MVKKLNLQSNAFYLTQILSLIELPYGAEGREIWPNGIDVDEIFGQLNINNLDFSAEYYQSN